MTLKVGSLVFATNQGLGILSKSFFDYGIINDILIVRHSSHVNYGTQWYPGFPVANEVPRNCKAAQWLCDKCDVMLFFETPFSWDLLPYCKRKGVKTVIMSMYECTPRHIPYEPDLWLCPSLLDLDYFGTGTLEGRKGIHLPVPIDTSIVQWRRRERARVFIHNAGNGGLKGRNGTGVLLDALRYVKSPITLLLRTQQRMQWNLPWEPDYLSSVDHATETTRYTLQSGALLIVQVGSIPYDDLWITGGIGEVFIHPHKWDGLSLPLQEACASGTLVMGVNRKPDNCWLSTEPLIPVERYQRCSISGAYQEFDEAIINPVSLANHIDDWYNKDISEYSLRGLEWAKANSWDVLGPQYHKVLGELVG